MEIADSVSFFKEIALHTSVGAVAGGKPVLLEHFVATAVQTSLLQKADLTDARIELVDATGRQIAITSLDALMKEGKAASDAAAPSPVAAPADAGDNAIEFGGTTAQHVFEKALDQTQIVGSAVMSYESGVDASVREAISDSLQFAKLYADSEAGDFEANPEQWVRSYQDVLDHAGWTVTDLLSANYAAQGTAATVHQAIISLLTVAMGNTLSGLALAQTVLQSLSKVSTGSWITLWRQQTLHANSAQFQFGVASVEDDKVVVNFAYLKVNASTILQQLLFFKWNSATAKLTGKSQKFVVNRRTLLEVAPVIRAKLQETGMNFFRPIGNLKNRATGALVTTP